MKKLALFLALIMSIFFTAQAYATNVHNNVKVKDFHYGWYMERNLYFAVREWKSV